MIGLTSHADTDLNKKGISQWNSYFKANMPDIYSCLTKHGRTCCYHEAKFL